MTTCKAPRKKPRPPRADVLPPVPDKRLWETNKARAFEASVRRFLAVSRAA